MSDLAPDELDHVIREWGEFASAKCFLFRGVTPEAFSLYWPAFARAIIKRSRVVVERREFDSVEDYNTGSWDIAAWAIIEDVPDSDAKILHCCYTARGYRNQGHMRTLLSDEGINKDSKVLVTMFTVLAEKMIEKLGWIYSPFAILKE